MALTWMIGPYAALAVGVMQAVSYSSRGRPWYGQGLLSVLTGYQAMPIILGIVAAAASVDTARLLRTCGGQFLPGRTVRRAFAFVLLGTIAPCIAAHTLVVAAAMALSHPRGMSASWLDLLGTWLAQAFLMALFGAMGALLARILDVISAAVVGAALGYLTIFYPPKERRFNPISSFTETASSLGLQSNPSYLVALLVTLSVCAVTIFAVATMSPLTTAARRWPRLLVASGLAMGTFAIPALGIDAARFDTSARPPSECAGTPTVVCLYPEQWPKEQQIRQSVQAFLGPLQRSPYQGSFGILRVESTSYGYVPSERGTAGIDPAQNFTLTDWASDLVIPDHCAAVRGMQSPPERYFTDLQLLTTTLLQVRRGDPPKATPAHVITIVRRWRGCQLG